MQIPPETIEVVVMAAPTLHNYLRNSCSKELYFLAGLTDTKMANCCLDCGDKTVVQFPFFPFRCFQQVIMLPQRLNG